HKAEVALPAALLKIGVQCTDALTIARRCRRKAGLKHRLKLFESGITKMLGEADKDRWVRAALLGNRVDRLHRDDIGVLGEKPSHLLKSITEGGIGFRDFIHEAFVVDMLGRCFRSLLYSRHVCLSPTWKWPSSRPHHI